MMDYALIAFLCGASFVLGGALMFLLIMAVIQFRNKTGREEFKKDVEEQLKRYTEEYFAKFRDEFSQIMEDQ